MVKSMRLYTREEKLAHVQQAEAYIKEGKGTYSSYAREVGVPRTTFHSWLHDLFPDGSRKPSTPTPQSGMVKLGKPVMQDARKGRFLVGYYGSSIEVGTTQDLVELLRSIKQASTT
jgi:transposase-like protein